MSKKNALWEIGYPLAAASFIFAVYIYAMVNNAPMPGKAILLLATIGMGSFAAYKYLTLNQWFEYKLVTEKMTNDLELSTICPECGHEFYYKLQPSSFDPSTGLPTHYQILVRCARCIDDGALRNFICTHLTLGEYPADHEYLVGLL